MAGSNSSEKLLNRKARPRMEVGGLQPTCWCRREDSNLHGAVNPTRSLAWRVFQFRHSDGSDSTGDSTVVLAQYEGESEGAYTEEDSYDHGESVEVALHLGRPGHGRG